MALTDLAAYGRVFERSRGVLDSDWRGLYAHIDVSPSCRRERAYFIFYKFSFNHAGLKNPLWIRLAVQ
jgi:hypothetical protein